MVGSVGDRGALSAECGTCGAVFGGFRIDAPTPADVALGVLLAGSTHDKYAASNALANVDWLPETTFYDNLPRVVEVIDDYFNDIMALHLESIRKEAGCRLVEIDPEKHFFISNRAAIQERIQGDMGLEVTQTNLVRRLYSAPLSALDRVLMKRLRSKNGSFARLIRAKIKV